MADYVDNSELYEAIAHCEDVKNRTCNECKEEHSKLQELLLELCAFRNASLFDMIHWENIEISSRRLYLRHMNSLKDVPDTIIQITDVSESRVVMEDLQRHTRDYSREDYCINFALYK